MNLADDPEILGQFSTEEMTGRFLDLTAQHQAFINLKNAILPIFVVRTQRSDYSMILAAKNRPDELVTNWEVILAWQKLKTVCPREYPLDELTRLQPHFPGPHTFHLFSYWRALDGDDVTLLEQHLARPQVELVTATGRVVVSVERAAGLGQRERLLGLAVSEGAQDQVRVDREAVVVLGGGGPRNSMPITLPVLTAGRSPTR